MIFFFLRLWSASISSNNTHLSALNCTRLFLPLTTTTTTAHSSSSGPTTPSPVPLTTKCQRSRQVTPTHPAKKACSLNLPRLWPFFAHAILEVLQLIFLQNQPSGMTKQKEHGKQKKLRLDFLPSLPLLLAVCPAMAHIPAPLRATNQPATSRQAGANTAPTLSAPPKTLQGQQAALQRA